jgi:adenylosuccinate lyase
MSQKEHKVGTWVNPLEAISPLDGRYYKDIKDLAQYTSEGALIRTRVEIEAKYLIALSQVGVIRKLNDSEIETLNTLGQNLDNKSVKSVKKKEEETNHDVKAMEYVFKSLLGHTSMADITEMVHFGLTSEDVNNLSYRLMFQRGKDNVVVPAVTNVVKHLSKKGDEYKELPIIAMTHGQAAVPTTLGKEFTNFATRIDKENYFFRNRKLTGKLNGAVGNYNALKFAAPEIDWVQFSKDFVGSLGLEPNLYTTQINSYHDIVESLQNILRINGAVLDLDQDMWRYISEGWLKQAIKEGEIGSSTMPQKVNPIKFENSEGNICIADGLIQGISKKILVSRLQRDLSDSTVVRNLGVVLGHSLLAYKNTLAGLNRVSPYEEKINSDLNKNWGVLSEGAQTLLRKKGFPQAYEEMVKLVKGKEIKNSQEWGEVVDQLKGVDDDTISKIKAMRPENYLGDASKLTSLALEGIKTRNN